MGVNLLWWDGMICCPAFLFNNSVENSLEIVKFAYYDEHMVGENCYEKCIDN